MKYLIVGLGNPGIAYERTRHNAGFLVLDHLAKRHQTTYQTLKLAHKAEVRYQGRALHLVKPTTYMNRSGQAVNYWLQALKIPKARLLVVVDDLALPCGKLRMRGKGSHAGHNGLKDIEAATEGKDYARLKFGIGSEFHPGQQADYVLSPFSEVQTESLLRAIDMACDMICSFCTVGVAQTMNQYNSH